MSDGNGEIEEMLPIGIAPELLRRNLRRNTLALQQTRTFTLILSVVLTAFAAPPALQAQYSQEWQVPQDYNERGFLYFDYNLDGSVELTKFYQNWVTVYDGADNWEILWNLSAPDHDELILWDLYTLSGNPERTAVFLANNLDPSTTRLQAFDLLAEAPAWETSDFDGSYSNIDTSDTDADDETEIVLGVNIYDSEEETYSSRFYVISDNGSIEYTSSVLQGYMIGPYCGDLDGDGLAEVLFNLYQAGTLTSTLHAWSSSPNVVRDHPGVLPLDIELGPNYPNPFNPSTTIPVTLMRQADVEIKVYNVVGREITTLMNGTLGAGLHTFHWDGLTAAGARVASGIYFVEIHVGDNHRVRRPMVLMK
ncbi:T9SS type A sorting domain-containing protein [bacterium]|nr:T9SS type A sorting domain-containing protein [bacterium]